MLKQFQKAVSIVILAAFISTSVRSPAYAQASAMPFMPKPGVMVHLSPAFSPAYLKGIVIHPENALKFDFIIYKGDKELTQPQKKDEYTKLIKYFLASLAIPDDDQWVNLSPYEKDRIIKDDFGKTEMGRDLLAQDYMLKQLTASLIYPKDNLGKEFWDRVYAQAQKQFGTTNIPVNTFNKVWILPDDALIYEKGNTAYILKNHLRVMLEEDYLSLSKHQGQPGDMALAVSPSTLPSELGLNLKATQRQPPHALTNQIIRQIVLPELEREVNEGKNFAALRQVYSGMLLAAWYKRALKESLLSRIYANKAKLKGVDQDPKTNEGIYQQYLKAYKKGVFNFIKDDVDKYTHETIPRKYFSGGTRGYSSNPAQFSKQVHIEHALDPVQEVAVQGELANDDLAQVAAVEQGENRNHDNAMTGTTLERLNEAWVESAKVEKDKTPPEVMAAFISYIVTGNIVELNERLDVNTQSITKPDFSHFGQAVLMTLKSYEQELHLNPELTEAYIAEREAAKNALLYHGDKGKDEKAFESAIVLFKNANTLFNLLKKSEKVGQLSGLFEDQMSQDAPKLAQAHRALHESFMRDLFGIDLEEEQEFKSVIISLIYKSKEEGNDKHFKELVRYLGIIAQAKAFRTIANVKFPTAPLALRGLLVKSVYRSLLDEQKKDIISRYVLIAAAMASLSSVYPFPGLKVSEKYAQEAVEYILYAFSEASAEMIKAEAKVQNKSADYVLEKIEEYSRRELKHGFTEDNIKLIKHFLKLGKNDDSTDDDLAMKTNPQSTSASTTLGKTLALIAVISMTSFAGLAVYKASSFHRINNEDINDLKITNAVVEKINKPDKAALVEEPLGGIDFNAAHLNLKIKRDGAGVPLPLNQQDMASLSHLEGLEPVILDIRPATSKIKVTDTFI